MLCKCNAMNYKKKKLDFLLFLMLPSARSNDQNIVIGVPILRVIPSVVCDKLSESNLPPKQDILACQNQR